MLRRAPLFSHKKLVFGFLFFFYKMFRHHFQMDVHTIGYVFTVCSYFGKHPPDGPSSLTTFLHVLFLFSSFPVPPSQPHNFAPTWTGEADMRWKVQHYFNSIHAHITAQHRHLTSDVQKRHTELLTYLYIRPVVQGVNPPHMDVIQCFQDAVMTPEQMKDKISGLERLFTAVVPYYASIRRGRKLFVPNETDADYLGHMAYLLHSENGLITRWSSGILVHVSPMFLAYKDHDDALDGLNKWVTDCLLNGDDGTTHEYYRPLVQSLGAHLNITWHREIGPGKDAPMTLNIGLHKRRADRESMSSKDRDLLRRTEYNIFRIYKHARDNNGEFRELLEMFE